MTNFVTLLQCIPLAGLALAIFIAARNHIVNSAHAQALNIIRGREDRRGLLEYYDSRPSYDAMIFDLRKWSFADFYPKLAAL